MQHVKNRIAHGQALLKRWLEKLGIADYLGLSLAEKATYDQWEAILTRELSLDDLRSFLAKQQVALSKELREAVRKGEDRVALVITARLENYDALIAFIDEPNRSRETLIAQITNLIAKPEI